MKRVMWFSNQVNLKYNSRLNFSENKDGIDNILIELTINNGQDGVDNS
jgi:hypothetical protein